MPDKTGVITSHSVSKSIMARIKERRANPAEIWGPSWALPTLDWMTGGVQDGLVILGAETGAGKSLIAGQFALAIAEQFAAEQNGKVVRVIHCEMTAEQFQERLIAQMSEVHARKLRSGVGMTDEDYAKVHQAAVDLSQLPIEYLEDPTGVEDTLEFIKRGGNCGWFLVDHAQAHQTSRPGLSPLDTKAIGELATALGSASKRTPGMLLSQLKNEVASREDHRPNQGDLYGGKGLTQPASLILLLYRPDIYQIQDEGRKYEPRTAHLYVTKNRWESEYGDVKLIWNPKEGMFRDAGFRSNEQQKAA